MKHALNPSKKSGAVCHPQPSLPVRHVTKACKTSPTAKPALSGTVGQAISRKLTDCISTLFKRAAAHKAMAIAALSSDSSLSVRLSRYSYHMSIARSLETDGDAK
ncbi:hypothetical protein YA0002_11485 [Pseudomonas cichorii]|uniref:hypothetical protein n=1 Tax=Pseudomonas cichorii TaxID=36746 RepID=UPI0018E65285|nr:hypothetical protein [Pseudomonas cichorii]MBI6853389.1 hypothetical protein [Pseudomonas cichorii]